MIRKKNSFDFISDILLPGLYLTVVLFLDRFVSHATITPLLGILGLMVMAFHLRPYVMIAWCTIFSLVAISIFLVQPIAQIINPEAVYSDTLTPVVRAATFCLGSVLASMLNITLQRSRDKNYDLQEIIRRMPVPMILSDIKGKIHFMNRAATSIMEISETEELSDSYFELFAPPESKGKTISDYLSRFEKQGIGRGLQLEINNTPYAGSTQRIISTSPTLLITILEPCSRNNIIEKG